MLQPLWISIVPQSGMAQLLLSEPGKGTVLKARLPLPQSNHALRMLLETVAHWYGRPLVAVLDADAEEVAAHPERWGVWLAEVDDLDVTVRWVRRGSERARDRFFDGVGESARARKLLSFEAGGQ